MGVVNIDKTVLETAIENITYAYENYPLVIVATSFGKDSGIVLNLAKMVAFKLGKLPVIATFTDEEVLDPYTEKCARDCLLNDPLVQLHWFCLEIPMKLGISTQDPHWVTWDKTKEALWVRQKPAGCITENEFPEWRNFVKKTKKDPFYLVNTLYFKDKYEKAIVLRGTRADESRNRFRAVHNEREDFWITKHPLMQYMYPSSPIYNWSTQDVWLAYRQFNWDYNPIYDVFAMYGISAERQRVCQPTYEYGLKYLPIYQRIFPEWWSKLRERFGDSIEAATRYADTYLFSTWKNIELPNNMTWESHCKNCLRLHTEDNRKKIEKKLHRLISNHKKSTGEVIPDSKPHKKTKVCWKSMTQIALTGDWDNRIESKFSFWN